MGYDFNREMKIAECLEVQYLILSADNVEAISVQFVMCDCALL